MISPEPDEAFARQLARAMTPVDPPPGFADRVCAAASRQSGGAVLAWPARRVRWLAVAAVLLTACLATLGGLHFREQQRHALVERQFDQAVAITDHALDHTRAQLVRAGIRLAP